MAVVLFLILGVIADVRSSAWRVPNAFIGEKVFSTAFRQGAGS
jgi:hypothetical protein